VVELDKLLMREIFEDGRIAKEIERKQKNLRGSIENAENNFSKLKSEFNSYLAENIKESERK
jgi:hypothetical protein